MKVSDINPIFHPSDFLRYPYELTLADRLINQKPILD